MVAFAGIKDGTPMDQCWEQQRLETPATRQSD